MPTTTVLSMIFSFCLILATAYGLLIYKSPMPHGWTWVSVVVGVGNICLSVALVMFVVLVEKRLLNEFWWFASITPIMSAVLGIPMIIFQIIKHQQEKKAIKRINDDK